MLFVYNFVCVNDKVSILFKKNFFKFIYFWERESKAEEGQRERKTQNLKQAPGSELSAQSLR